MDRRFFRGSKFRLDRQIESMDRVSDIEQQLAHMRWRRVQNERAIRENIDISNELHNRDQIVKLSSKSGEEKIMWVTSVVRDEVVRPLVLSDAEVRKLEEDDVIRREKLIKQCIRQVDTVKKLKKVVQERIEKDEGGRQQQVEKLAQLNLIEKKLQNNKNSLKQKKQEEIEIKLMENDSQTTKKSIGRQLNEEKYARLSDIEMRLKNNMSALEKEPFMFPKKVFGTFPHDPNKPKRR